MVGVDRVAISQRRGEETGKKVSPYIDPHKMRILV